MLDSVLRVALVEGAQEFVGDGDGQDAAAVGEAKTHEERERVARVLLHAVQLVAGGRVVDALALEVLGEQRGARGHSRGGVVVKYIFNVAIKLVS